VEAGEIALFIAGDAAYSEWSLLEGRIDSVSPNEDVTLRTLESIRRFAASTPTAFPPTHDPAAAQRLTNSETVPTGRALRRSPSAPAVDVTFPSPAMQRKQRGVKAAPLSQRVELWQIAV
jgi:glyoxylase-like metal-dependent hydrolase (beta-lactamase superfamily II)